MMSKGPGQRLRGDPTRGSNRRWRQRRERRPPGAPLALTRVRAAAGPLWQQPRTSRCRRGCRGHSGDHIALIVFTGGTMAAPTRSLPLSSRESTTTQPRPTTVGRQRRLSATSPSLLRGRSPSNSHDGPGSSRRRPPRRQLPPRPSRDHDGTTAATPTRRRRRPRPRPPQPPTTEAPTTTERRQPRPRRQPLRRRRRPRRPQRRRTLPPKSKRPSQASSESTTTRHRGERLRRPRRKQPPSPGDPTRRHTGRDREGEITVSPPGHRDPTCPEVPQPTRSGRRAMSLGPKSHQRGQRAGTDAAHPRCGRKGQMERQPPNRDGQRQHVVVRRSRHRSTTSPRPTRHWRQASAVGSAPQERVRQSFLPATVDVQDPATDGVRRRGPDRREKRAQACGSTTHRQGPAGERPGT